MRYLSLAEALAVAEAVTGIEVAVHARSSRINLLDSALHTPQASFGGHDMYPVPALRISRNHPLLDGNKRLAWGCLVMFCALNGHDLHVPTEEAVRTMLSVATGDLDEAGFAQWLAVWVDRED